MAGVGIELERLLRKGTLISTLQAFLYGSVLAAGPVLLTYLTVGVIGWMSYGLIGPAALQLFSVTIVYTFAFSLILAGPFQILFTRYVADKDFSRRHEDIFPGFLTSTLIVTAIAGLAALLFYLRLDVSDAVGSVALYKVFAALSFVAVCFIWQLVGFVSTTKEYHKVLWIYVAGTVVSILLAYLLIPRITVAGGIAGFCLGQVVVAVLLFALLTKGIPKTRYLDKEYLTYFRRYPLVALTGLLYNLGVWADKFVFWMHLGEQSGASLFYTYNYYDVPNFIAFLTIIPGLSYFLILTETSFYREYSAFLTDVLHRPRLLISQRKQSMITTLRDGFRGMMKLQGIITLLLIVFAEPVLIALGYKGVSVHLFRILLLGVYFHVLMLCANVLLLYYEKRRDAFLFSLLFATSNTALTAITLRLGVPFFGIGFLSATALTFLVAWRLLFRAADQIDYYIFTSQPVHAVVQERPPVLWHRLWRRLHRLKQKRVNGNARYPEYYT